MSISAGWLVLAVVALRFVTRRASKWTRCLLWLLVAVRLVCPVLPESRVSLMPQFEVSSRAEGGALTGVLDRTLPPLEFETPRDAAINRAAGQSGRNVRVSTSAPPSEYLPFVWAGGMLAMLLYALVSYLRLRRRVAASAPLEDGVLLCDAIDAPFILGVFRPRVYLPSGLDGPRRSHVLAHERAHLARRDHWWKPLGYLLLAIHWFNPLLWLAYLLLCRDIELACDERVVRGLTAEGRADYSQALLDCSRPRPGLAACPLAFGEVGVRGRIKAALSYKRPAFWVAAAAVVACAAAAVCFLTDPKPASDGRPEPAALSACLPGNRTAPAVRAWVDESPETLEWGGTRTAELPELPGTTFTWTAYRVTVTDGDGERALGGMPVWNAFFADLNGDGVPELCMTVSFGSGAIDEHVVVYDPAAKESYTLWDRMEYDYLLSAEDGVLVVSKCPYPLISADFRSAQAEMRGTLVLEDGALRMVQFLDDAVGRAIIDHNRGRFAAGDFRAESHVTLAVEGADDPAGGDVTVYLMALYQEYGYAGAGFRAIGGAHRPAALTFRVNGAGDGYDLADYWEPRDGDYYWPDVRGRFPASVSDAALDTRMWAARSQMECDAKAIAYGVIDPDEMIAALFVEIASYPSWSSAPGDYIDAHPDQVSQLERYGEYTLRYIFRRFLAGGEYGLEGHLMRSVMDRIIGDEKLEGWSRSWQGAEAGTGQGYFDAWFAQVRQLEAEHGREWVRKYRPAGELALRVHEGDA